MTYLNGGILVAIVLYFSLPGSLRLTLDALDQGRNVFSATIDVFPNVFLGIGGRAGVATSTTNKYFAILSGLPGHFARRVSSIESGQRHDGSPSIYSC